MNIEGKVMYYVVFYYWFLIVVHRLIY